MESSDEVGYYCRTCETYLTSSRNRTRHEKSHRICSVCLKVRSRNGHHCNPTNTANVIQWIAITDAQGKPVVYVLGLTPEAFAKHNRQVSEQNRLETIIQTSLDNNGRGDGSSTSSTLDGSG